MTMLRRTITAIVMISAVIVVLGILVVFGARPTNTSLTSASAADMPQQVTTANNTANSSDTANQSGGRLNNASMIFIDPKTGELTSTPPEDYQLNLSPEQLNAFSTSTEGLVVEKAPWGGNIIRPNGRFMSSTIGTIDTNGQFKIQCLSGIPTAPQTADTNGVITPDSGGE